MKKRANPHLVTLARLADFPMLTISLGTTLYNRTGSWRTFRPRYHEKVPPCTNACPAHEPIQGYLDLLVQGKVKQAARLVRTVQPFPSILGRVCFHPCEPACNRAQYDEPLAVHHVERYIGDVGLEMAAAKSKESGAGRSRGARIAIVGAGPAGMAAAHVLVRLGYRVTVLDAQPRPGGMLRVGIPAYRLPREVLDAELRQLERAGVEFRTGVRVGKDVDFERLAVANAAVLVATGAHRSRRLGVRGEQANGVMAGLEFLARVNLGEPVEIGHRVAVIGGGNTAIDAARSALRLGSEPRILYRRTRAEMPAIAEEVDEAIREGIEVKFLVAPVRVVTKDGKVTGLECQSMELGTPDASGRRRPVPVKGSEFVIELDTVLTAIGEEVDRSFLDPSVPVTDWGIRANEHGVTGAPGIFAAGDCVTGPKTVIEAVGHGLRAARALDRILKGGKPATAPEPRIVSFDEVNLDYFEHVPRHAMPRRESWKADVGRQKADAGGSGAAFVEVNLGYDAAASAAEALRCFSCGVCNKCDNCRIFCPDIAISVRNGRYEVNYDYCKGCGVCVTECPRRVIDLVEERDAAKS